jgi:NADPH2:quinone reductase
MKTNAIRVHKLGGPEEMILEQVEVAAPKENEVIIKQNAIGLNFIDTYFRSGLYPATLPTPIGMEAAGIIEKLGPGISEFKVGDRVAYASAPLGSYSEFRTFPITNLVKIPDDISDDLAAAIMLKGMTAEYLIRRTFKVEEGQTVLFHATAGGVGLIACQWLKAIGATVIGTVGSHEKAELAKANGCDHTILYKEENFADRVKEITNGAGVPVVYDSVGKDTALQSLDCLSPLGLLVLFGNSSGNAPAIEPGLLATKGSLYVTRPTLFNYNDTREKLMESANQVFNMIRNGKVSIKIGAKYELKNAVQAHKDLESRKTSGCIILRP